MRRLALLLCLSLLSQQASATVVKGVDFRDAFGGLVGLAAVVFFMVLCFKGDRNPPAPGYLTNKREERILRGESGGAGPDVEAE